MLTVLPDQELKQAWNFFLMGKKSLNLEDYLEALKNVGIVLNKTEIQTIQDSGKADFGEADFLKTYNDKMNELTKEELLKVFQEFDPESTGSIAYEILHRALVTYGERFEKKEMEQFVQTFKLKPNEPVNYNEIVEEIVKINS